MAHESNKAMMRRAFLPKFRKIYKGRGIDIGSGSAPIPLFDFPDVQSIETFDLKDGDAQYITKYKTPESYDFVNSSHCLEHLSDPIAALKEWFALVKDEGYVVLTIPDEDLYEQGCWPSVYSNDHKWTFTIYKNFNLNNKSINVLDMVKTLKDCRVISIEYIDTHYQYGKRTDQTNTIAECCIEVVIKKEKEKYCVIRHGAIGDVICSTPIIRYLKNLRPEADIYVQTKYPQVFENSPYIKECGNYIPPNCKIIELGGAYESNKNMHIIEAYFSKLNKFGLDHEDVRLEIFKSSEDVRVVEELLNKIKVDRYCVVHLGNNWSKIETEFLRKCLTYLSQKIHVIFIGLGTEENISVHNSTNLTRIGWNIQKVQHLISKSSLYFGLDTGMSYVAGSTTVPMILLYSWQSKQIRGPIRKDVICVHGTCEQHDQCYKKNNNDKIFFTGIKCPLDDKFKCAKLDFNEVVTNIDNYIK